MSLLSPSNSSPTANERASKRLSERASDRPTGRPTAPRRPFSTDLCRCGRSVRTSARKQNEGDIRRNEATSGGSARREYARDTRGKFSAIPDIARVHTYVTSACTYLHYIGVFLRAFPMAIGRDRSCRDTFDRARENVTGMLFLLYVELTHFSFFFTDARRVFDEDDRTKT